MISAIGLLLNEMSIEMFMKSKEKFESKRICAEVSSNENWRINQIEESISKRN